MKVFSLLLLAFAPCVHAAGRLELINGAIFLQSDLAAPSVEPYSGLLPYGDFSLRWVWPSGFKLGGRHVSRITTCVPSAEIKDGTNIRAVSLALVPNVSLLELTLPLFHPGAFSLSASLGMGQASWTGLLDAKVTSAPGSQDLIEAYCMNQSTFACSAFLNMDWEVSSHFALRLYGGYVYLGKPDLSGLKAGFKSDVGGLAFGLGFGIK